MNVRAAIGKGAVSACRQVLFPATTSTANTIGQPILMQSLRLDENPSEAIPNSFIYIISLLLNRIK
jgi:hypothetical protein